MRFFQVYLSLICISAAAHAAPKPHHTAATHARTTHASVKRGSAHATSSAHGKATHGKAVPAHPATSGMDPERATQIQTALIKNGYLSGEATGKWDADSAAAMQKLQSDNGWQTKIVPDSRALIKLGLGPQPN